MVVYLQSEVVERVSSTLAAEESVIVSLLPSFFDKKQRNIISIIMGNATEKPLWLELRKEYIDDNFEQLVVYLSQNNSTNEQDSFFRITTQLLKDRVIEQVQFLSKKELFCSPDKTEATIFNIRLFAAFLLTLPKDESATQIYVAMMSELMVLSPKFSNKILETTLKRLTHTQLDALGFSWGDIKTFSPETFAYCAIHNCAFSKPLQATSFFENGGTVCLSSKGLELAAVGRGNFDKLRLSGSKSLEIGAGIAVRTSTGTKLKQSDANKLPALDEFTNNFIESLAPRKTNLSQKLRYSDGDEVVVRVKSISQNKIHVTTIDRKYQTLVGTISFTKPNISYYPVSLFPKNLEEGDFLKVTIESVDNGYFDIEKQFTTYVVEDCRKDCGYEEFEACLKYKNKTTMVWMNDRGTYVISKLLNDYQIGDYAILRAISYGTGDEYGKITTEIIEPFIPEEDELFAPDIEELCVQDFAQSTPDPNEGEDPQDTVLNLEILQLLVRELFSLQKTLLKPAERYICLSNARILAELTNDHLASSFIKFSSSYLLALVKFVNNEPIDDITLEPDEVFKDAEETMLRLSIIELLKQYGKTDFSYVNSDDDTTNQTLASLSRLIHSSNSMKGILSDAALNVIKREIIKTLSLETENETDLEDGGSYLGVESGTMEFKTSFVYSSDSMHVNQTIQELNVFKGICAFMNSTTGGTLFLGVNDQGYVVGLDNDLAVLRMNSIDQYMRHIQDRAKFYFDIDGIAHLRIEPAYDNQVVAIHVEPHPYRVVELNGVAYLRINAESRIMPDKMKEELIARKVFKDKDKAAALSQLQHAMSQKKCVILHNYSSNNTGVISDRFVEAYDVLPEDDLIMCYDRDTTDSRKLKMFRISRIGWVEVKDEHWYHESQHQKICVDAFHMTGDKEITISLQLDLLAKNLLVEEYPRTKDDITQQRGNDNVWYLTTKVYNIAGIARFYLGLAEHISILDAPQLQSYVKEYKEKYLD